MVNEDDCSKVKALNCHFDHISVESWWCGKIGAADHQSFWRKRDRKEGQKLIQGAMIRKDGAQRKKKLADFSCPITLLSRVSFSFEESKAFACRRLFWEESTSFDPSAITTCPGAQLSKELSLLTSQPKWKTKNLCAARFIWRNIGCKTKEVYGWTHIEGLHWWKQ